MSESHSSEEVTLADLLAPHWGCGNCASEDTHADHLADVLKDFIAARVAEAEAEVRRVTRADTLDAACAHIERGGQTRELRALAGMVRDGAVLEYGPLTLTQDGDFNSDVVRFRAAQTVRVAYPEAQRIRNEEPS
jgi:hypothetical protein